MSVKNRMTPADYEQLRALIKGCFPDPASPLSQVTDAMVDVFVHSDWANDTFDAAQRTQLGIPPPPPGFTPPAVVVGAEGPEVVGYYNATATHSRTRGGQAWDSFTGHLPLARVRLAQSSRAAISTAIGLVDGTTSLFLTVDEFNQRLANEPGFKHAGAVEVITPPRMGGERFAAVAIYLSYAAAGDAAPQAYLLEAGLAQGGPRVPFYGATMQTVIVQQTNYEPTAFSRTSHWYRGTLGVITNEPGLLHIEAFVDKPLTKKYMDVQVQYAAASAQSVSKVNPFFIRAEAALRVMAIAESLDVNVAPGFVQSILATVAKVLAWHRPPPS